VGYLDLGTWVTREQLPKDTQGRFARNKAAFRSFVTRDGSSGFRVEAGRYHLVLAHACPWCHRVAIVRALKGLQDVISVSFAHPLMRENGWAFTETHPDPLFSARFAHQLYTRAAPGHSGRVTVPILWDRQTATIVNNESSELIRMLTSTFDELSSAPGLDLYPEALRAEIDAVNDLVYDSVNNGVYKCGFAGTQPAYNEAVRALFTALDTLEARLRDQTYLVGDQLTEADIRLWVTLVRFDLVYVGHFKCNLRRIADYPALSRYLRRLYAMDAFRTTTQLDEIKLHYYASHRSVNPSGIVPIGPELMLENDK